MRFRHLTAAHYSIMPWANGRGQTVELLKIKDIAGALRLRLSVADVVEAGAFSRLPDIDRVLTLIEGDGFDLDFGGAAPGVRALPFVPVAFSGDWATSAANVRGPSRDFNVMTAAGLYDVDVRRLPAGQSVWPDAGEPLPKDGKVLGFLYVVTGSAEVSGAQSALGVGDLLIIEGRDSVDVSADGAVLAIRAVLRN